MSPGHGENFSEDRLVIYDTVLAQGSYSMELSSPRDGILAILDGVGGINGGAFASAFIASSLTLNSEKMEVQALRELLLDDDDYLRENARGATTASGLLLRGEKTYVFHVGNTRIYMEEEGYLSPITDDHTLVREYGYTPGTAQYAENQHIITACLGGKSGGAEKKLQIKEVVLPRSGSWLFTCDGIHDNLDVYDMEQVVLTDDRPDELIRMARSAGSEDDCSYLLIRW